jgi:hypothetical protein
MPFGNHHINAERLQVGRNLKGRIFQASLISCHSGSDPKVVVHPHLSRDASQAAIASEIVARMCGLNAELLFHFRRPGSRDGSAASLAASKAPKAHSSPLSSLSINGNTSVLSRIANPSSASARTEESVSPVAKSNAARTAGVSISCIASSIVAQSRLDTSLSRVRAMSSIKFCSAKSLPLSGT